MELADITSRTGITGRRLRYVLDHDVLPGWRGSEGRGVPRCLTDYEALGIAVAATLMDAGLKRHVAADVMELICKNTGKNMHIETILPGPADLDGAMLEIGDGINVRFTSHGTRRRGRDTGWIQAETGAKLDAGYVPMIRVSIDIGRLAALLMKA